MKATRTVVILMAIFTTGIGAHPIVNRNSAGQMVRLELCTSEKQKTSIEMDFGDPDKPAPNHQGSACHAPCICDRKNGVVIKTRKTSRSKPPA